MQYDQEIEQQYHPENFTPERPECERCGVLISQEDIIFINDEVYYYCNICREEYAI